MHRTRGLKLRWCILAGLLCCLCSGALGAGGAEGNADPQAVIVCSGNTRGIFEPCRCPKNPYGGVARRATWLIQYRKEHPSVVLVDSGDVFDPDTAQERGDLLTWGYRLCGYDAVALGSRDVMYSRKVGAERFKASGIPWVCGNMESAREELGVERYRVLSRGGKRIGITALLGTQLVNSDVLKEEKPPIVLSDPQEALRSLVSELKGKTDVLCVVAHMPYPRAQQIYERFPEAEVVILGHDMRYSKKEEASAPSARVFVETGPTGQYMTAVELVRGAADDRREWTVSPAPVSAKVEKHPELWQRYLALQNEADLQARTPAGLEAFETHMSGGETSPTDPARVPIAVFKSEGCTTCALIEPDKLAELGKRIGCRIDPKYYLLDRGSEYELLLQLERRYNDSGNELPVVFVGTHVLGGPEEIEAHLAELARQSAGKEHPDHVVEVVKEEPEAVTEPVEVIHPLYLAYFDEPGCPECRRVKYALKRLVRLAPKITVKTFDVSRPQDRLFQEALAERLGVPSEKRLLTPMVCAGSDALIKEDVTDARLEALVAKYADAGAPALWEMDLDLELARLKLRERFRSLGVFAIMLGGLADGVNPCAFATLILFVSLLKAASAKRQMILTVGLSFAVGVFMAYLAVGLGLSQVVRWINAVPLLDAAVTWGIVGLCGLLAILSLWDMVKAGRGRLREMKLQLPEKLKETIRRMLIRFRRTSHLLVGGFVAGALVSLVELACTGQVYLPIIKLMVATAGGERLKAFLLLVFYNLCFIVPLLIVLAAVSWGTSSERLTAFFRRRAALAKALLAGLFVLMFVLLVGFGLNSIH